MFAALIDDNSNITLPQDNSDNNILNQKRHKKTQRKYPKIEHFDTHKVNSVLKQLHENTEDDDDNEDDANNTHNNKAFNPPPKPESSGVNKTIPLLSNSTATTTAAGREGMFVGKAPSPNYEGGDNLDLNDYNNYGDDKTAQNYYKKVLNGYVKQPTTNLNTYPPSSYRPSNPNLYHNYENPSPDILLQKLNYMISLLENQQDEKTDNVVEEVILYSFLGIFIIFIADTFVKAGKYTR